MTDTEKDRELSSVESGHNLTVEPAGVSDVTYGNQDIDLMPRESQELLRGSDATYGNQDIDLTPRDSLEPSGGLDETYGNLDLTPRDSLEPSGGLDVSYRNQDIEMVPREIQETAVTYRNQDNDLVSCKSQHNVAAIANPEEDAQGSSRVSETEGLTVMSLPPGEYERPDLMEQESQQDQAEVTHQRPLRGQDAIVVSIREQESNTVADDLPGVLTDQSVVAILGQTERLTVTSLPPGECERPDLMEQGSQQDKDEVTHQRPPPGQDAAMMSSIGQECSTAAGGLPGVLFNLPVPAILGLSPSENRVETGPSTSMEEDWNDQQIYCYQEGNLETETQSSVYDAQSGSSVDNEEWQKCTKHPGHPEFIPATSFTHEHLPEGNRGHFKVIELLSELTVRLRIHQTSGSRFPQTNHGQFMKRNSNCIRVCTGFILCEDIRKWISMFEPTNIWKQRAIAESENVDEEIERLKDEFDYNKIKLYVSSKLNTLGLQFDEEAIDDWNLKLMCTQVWTAIREGDKKLRQDLFLKKIVLLTASELTNAGIDMDVLDGTYEALENSVKLLPANEIPHVNEDSPITRTNELPHVNEDSPITRTNELPHVNEDSPITRTNELPHVNEDSPITRTNELPHVNEDSPITRTNELPHVNEDSPITRTNELPHVNEDSPITRTNELPHVNEDSPITRTNELPHVNEDSPITRNIGYRFSVITDRRAINDNEEAMNTEIDLVFKNGEMKSLYGTSIKVLSENCDLAVLECVTHDEQLAEKIKDLCNEFNQSSLRLAVTNDQPVAVICSYPHGYSKMISVGEWTMRWFHPCGQTSPLMYVSYEYTAPTCPGCAGAPVLVLGKMPGAQNVHKQMVSHSGNLCRNINRSGIGHGLYYGKPNTNTESKPDTNTESKPDTNTESKDDSADETYSSASENMDQ